LRQYFCAKKFQSQTVTREKLPKILSYEKGALKTLMKLTQYGKEEETKRHLYDNEISFSRLEEKNKENRKQQNGSETEETRI